MTWKRLGWGVVLVVGLVCVLGVQAQSGARGASPAPSPSVAAGPTASMLRLIKFSGSELDVHGQPLQGTVGVTFALYSEQQGGSPLWLETQNVTLDNQGHYTALLGATQNGGLPLEIFSSGEARWLGIQVQGQAEQPRVLLVAVPYALKAAEAETLSGKRASDFVTTEQLPEQVQKVVAEQKADSTSASRTTTGEGGKAVNSSGAMNFTDTTTDQVVKVTQNGTGYAVLGIGKNSNGIFGATQAANSNVYGLFGQTVGEKGGALIGYANSTTGTAVGVQGVSKSATGTAGSFVNTAGGDILVGRGAGNTEVFSVDGSGNVAATSFAGDGSNLTGLPGWSLTGNAGTTAGTNFVGTTDNVPLELHVNGERALRLEPSFFGTPNVIGGYSGNSVSGGSDGATIFGGGGPGGSLPNHVTGAFGTVSGGYDNIAGPIEGGTVGGGAGNTASGQEATVSGGQHNLASGNFATVPGGNFNTAQGGYSFAAGRRAQANHNGAFVWGDSTNADVSSTANNQFTIRADGGFRMLNAAGTQVFGIDNTGSVTLGPSAGLYATSSTENLRIVHGEVISDGTISSGTDFTVTHNSTGFYTVTMDSGIFSGGTDQSVIPFFNTSPIIPAIVAFGGDGSFEVRFFDTSGAATDANFAFIAVAPR